MEYFLAYTSYDKNRFDIFLGMIQVILQGNKDGIR